MLSGVIENLCTQFMRCLCMTMHPLEYDETRRESVMFSRLSDLQLDQ